jgi:diguanylate cyclase (GGDEF)-like protein
MTTGHEGSAAPPDRRQGSSGGAEGREPAPDELLGGILESVAAGVCVWDADLRLVTWNTAFRNLFAIPDHVLRIGARLAEILDSGTPLLDDARGGMELETLTRKRLAADGRLELDRVLVDGHIVAVTYHAFSGGRWIAIYHDVTDRRQDIKRLRDSEGELKRQNARLDASLDSMPYGFSIWDDEFRLVLWNKRYIEIYDLPSKDFRAGMPLEEVCELTIAAGNHPNWSPAELFETYRLRLLDCTASTPDHAYEKNIRGRTIKSTYRLSPGLGWVVTHEDITEHIARMRALEEREVELKRQNIRFEAAVDNMSQGLCMFDREHKLVICNKRYADVYGLPSELVRPGTTLQEILQNRVSRGVHPTVGAEAYIQRRIELVTNAKEDVDTVELADGRVISVLHHPMSDGGWVSTHQDVTEQRRIEERIRYLARHDALTDLPNRMDFLERMDAVEAHTQRGDQMAVLCIDLDHFKIVNDTLGHATGDAVLRAVGARLRAACREHDIVARLGGDEFAVLHGPLDHAEAASALADRIVKAMAEPFEVQDHHILIGASVGIAVGPSDGHNADTLMKSADLALYRAKADGRGAYHFFEKGMDAALQQRLALEIGLRKAMVEGELRLVFQPLYNLSENRVCGLEALLRWEHPERGTVMPEEIIPIAEETGLIVPIGEWVLREACAAAAHWPENVRIAVNLSPVQFKNRNLVQHVVSALATSGLSANRLELEVTESVLLAENELTLRTLHQLRELGVRISMDDFGTGYSSLSHIRSFPFDKIKIDQSFVHDLSVRRDSLAIVKALIGLGRSLGIATTAEGVETEDQLLMVREEGCTEVQGFLFSPPLPATVVANLFPAREDASPSATLKTAS